MPELMWTPPLSLVGVDVVVHVRRLRILAEHRIVVGRAGRLHRAQRDALHVRGEQPGADQPVGLGPPSGSSAYCLTSEPKTSEIDLVQRARLAVVDQLASSSVTPWVSSWPITSSEIVKRLNSSPSPSPKTICWPSQKALS